MILVLLIVPLLAATQTVTAQVPQPQNSELSNISTRGFVQTGDNVLIAGFIIQGTFPKSVIIRALGPELTPYGVPDALANPTLELHDGGGLLIASNDNWGRTIIGGIITLTKSATSETAATLRVTDGNRRSSQTCRRVTTPRSCVVLTIPLELLLWKCTIYPHPHPHHQHRLRLRLRLPDFHNQYLPLSQQRHLKKIVPNDSAFRKQNQSEQWKAPATVL